jgi:hypothetical protein
MNLLRFLRLSTIMVHDPFPDAQRWTASGLVSHGDAARAKALPSILSQSNTPLSF